jgi:carboxypeptidase C (cathepsin A)
MSGEFDSKDGSITQTVWMQETLKELPESFWTQDRKIYYFKTPNDDQLRNGGYYRRTGNFTFVTTPKAGHFIPHDYYDASKAYLDDWVTHLAL